MASARSTLTVACRSARRLDDDVAQPRLPGADAETADAFDTGRPALSSAPPTNSRMRLSSVGIPSSMARDGAEHLRVEAHQPRLFERDGAEAVSDR